MTCCIIQPSIEMFSMLRNWCTAASYEHALVNKLAQALRDAQHRFVIVDAPLLYAAGVQSFCAVAKVWIYLQLDPVLRSHGSH